ncbi:hypothetical protein JCM19298_1002 [Nonlabens ulvanivorans]|nr:hypothetical protein JCM19298_1002 [Nonlabens ulvanivorans]
MRGYFPLYENAFEKVNMFEDIFLCGSRFRESETSTNPLNLIKAL